MGETGNTGPVDRYGNSIEDIENNNESREENRKEQERLAAEKREALLKIADESGVVPAHKRNTR